MSDDQNPAKPVSNDEKFKPQNVQNEGAGQSGGKGRPDRNMKDTARGSEHHTQRKSMNRP